ncbi:MAG: GntR family transcriptional regulator [Lachnospiraceae bacterium]|nr:GntR family transcriptional regulator [Lachnospiraceae bacterium]
MSLKFEPRKKESAVDIVVNSIRSLIMEKKLQPGDKIPVETEIAEGLNVSRSSVREAMKILSAFGLIEIKVGNGTYVSQNSNTTAIDSFLTSLLLCNPNLEELIEFRAVMEKNVMELVIIHYDENEEDRTALYENLNELRLLVNSDCPSSVIAQNDIDFHKILSKASHNMMLEKVYNFILEFFELSIKATHKTQHGKIAYEVHKQLVDAIETRDLNEAKKAVYSSVITWSSLVY